MSYFAFVLSRGGLTQPVFVGQIKAKTAGEAFTAAAKRPEVKRFVGKQQTGDLVLRVYVAPTVEAARQQALA